MVIGLGKQIEDIIQVNTEDSYWLSLIELNSPVPDAYNRTTDWLLRAEKQRQVYLVHNSSRIELTGPKALTALNLTFDDVVVIGEDQDVDLLPLLPGHLD